MKEIGAGRSEAHHLTSQNFRGERENQDRLKRGQDIEEFSTTLIN